MLGHHGVQQQRLHVPQEDGRAAVGGHQQRRVVARAGETELGHPLPAAARASGGQWSAANTLAGIS